MTDPEATAPPVRKPRNLRSAIEWLLAHPAVSIPVATFLLGVVVGWVLL